MTAQTPSAKTLYKAMHRAARAAKNYGRDRPKVHPIAARLHVAGLTPSEAANETATRLGAQERVKPVRAATLFMRRTAGMHSRLSMREPGAILHDQENPRPVQYPHERRKWLLV